MAAIVLPEPGGEWCCVECEHIDCATMREQREWICVHCGEPIASRPSYVRPGGEHCEHEACALEAQEEIV